MIWPHLFDLFGTAPEKRHNEAEENLEEMLND